MPEQRKVSPLLDGFSVGNPIGSHYGVSCSPAISGSASVAANRYIVKSVSIPQSQSQLDALLITGAFRSSAAAADYFKELANEVSNEAELLRKLSTQEGFMPFSGWQIEPMADGKLGYEVFLLSSYRLSFEKYMRRHSISHLEAVNLGIDLCAALAACRRSGYLYIDLKPSNIFISPKKEFKIGDLGFVALNSLKYTSMPVKYRSAYTAPEMLDDLNVINTTVDTYSVGMILYQIFNYGHLPENRRQLDPPSNGDAEINSILLKACHPDPGRRWETPTEMWQALVDYMQRNAVNNTQVMPALSPMDKTTTLARFKLAEMAKEEEKDEEVAQTVSEETNTAYAEDTRSTEPEPVLEVSQDIDADSSAEELPEPTIPSDDFEEHEDSEEYEESEISEFFADEDLDEIKFVAPEPIQDETVAAFDPGPMTGENSDDGMAEIASGTENLMLPPDSVSQAPVSSDDVEDADDSSVSSTAEEIILEAPKPIDDESLDFVPPDSASDSAEAGQEQTADSSESSAEISSDQLMLDVSAPSSEDMESSLKLDLPQPVLMDSAKPIKLDIPNSRQKEALLADIEEKASSVQQPVAVSASGKPRKRTKPLFEDSSSPNFFQSSMDDTQTEAADSGEQSLDAELEEVNRLLKSSTSNMPRLQPQSAAAPEKKNKGAKKFFAAVLTLAILSGIGFLGYYGYRNFYIQTIDALTVDGTMDAITVTVDSNIKDELLSVVCVDAYGTAVTSSVTNGTAQFKDLKPGSLYKIQVEINGNHKLEGAVSEIYTTENATNIVNISAVTGAEEGSVLLNLTVEGHEPDKWRVIYGAEGEADQRMEFSGHAATITGLELGKTYTFRLETVDETPVTGNKELEFTVSGLVIAEDLKIDSVADGVMELSWSAPENAEVEGWKVRCYNETFDQTIDVTETKAAFSEIDSTRPYTIEVTANGMTQAAQVTITANPVTLKDVTFDDSDPTKLTINWSYIGKAPEGGWIVMYTIDGNATPDLIKCTEPTAVISPRIPDAEYNVIIQSPETVSIFNNEHSYQSPKAQPFQDHLLNANALTAMLLQTPEDLNWNYFTTPYEMFKDTFSPGQSISMVLKSGSNFYLDDEPVVVLFLIRDADGKVMTDLTVCEERNWAHLWEAKDYHIASLNAANAPSVSGNYTLEMYFDGALATSTPFTVS